MSQCKENEDIFVSFHLLTAGKGEAEKTLSAHITEGNLADLTTLLSRPCII
jgi:hypothetical protein